MDEIAQRLEDAEGSGRVEFKRSCLWPSETDPLKVQSVLMRLANANPEVGGLVHLGREDDGRLVGLVDKDLVPATPQQIKASEQTLVRTAEKLDPPMHIRWFTHETLGCATVVVEVPGRPRGGWYQDEHGVTKTGSASHPSIARQSLLQRWAREVNEPIYQLGVIAFVNAMILGSGNEAMETFQVLNVAIRNVGTATSYVESVGFLFDFNGISESVSFFNPFSDFVLNQLSAKLHDPIEPGSKQTFKYNLEKAIRSLRDYPAQFQGRRTIDWTKFALLAVFVTDELGNLYRETVTKETQEAVSRVLLEGPGETKKY